MIPPLQAAPPQAYQPPVTPQVYQQSAAPQAYQAYQQPVPPGTLPPDQQSAIRNYQQQYQQTWQQPYQPEPPKRKSKGLIIALVVILVVALAAGAAYALAGRQIRRLILGPKASYLAIESSNLKDNTADLVDDLVRIGNVRTPDVKGGSSIELAVELPGLAAGMDPALVESLQKLSLNATYLYDRSEADPRYYTSLDLLTQDEKLLTLDVFIEKDRIVLGLPDILDSYVFADSTALSGLAGSLGTGIDMTGSPTDLLSGIMSLNLEIDQAKMESSLNKLIDIVMKHIDKAEFSGSQAITAGSVTGKYDRYTITITSENMRLMFIELFETIRDDDELFNLAAKVYGLYASADPAAAAADGAVLTRETWEKTLNDTISSLKEEPAPEDAFTLVHQMYVDNKDQVRGREITILDNTGKQTGHLQYLNPVDGDKEGLLIAYEGDVDSGKLVADYTVKDERKTGQATLTVADKEILTATFSGLDAVVIDEKDYLLGDVEIEVKDPSVSLPGNLIYKGSESGGKFTGELGLKDYAIAKIGYQEIPATSAVIPEYDSTKLVDANDQEALQGLMTEDVMNQLTTIMSKLGLSTP